MPNIPGSLLHEGASIDIAFGEPRPSFGDLFCICGHSHPSFPPMGSVDFSALADLQFDQVDDYFGIPSLGDEGDDVVVWLFPLVDGEPVHHHPGPFDGIRIEYCILRNSAWHAVHFLRCVHELARFGIGVYYRNRESELGTPPDLSTVRADIEAIVRHWAAAGITVGSDEAMEVDF